jgi:addiction module RelE/StbE family toxin
LFRVLPKKQFLKTSARLTKRNSSLDPQLSKVLETLENDPFAPSLKTHKLKGNLAGLYACSLTHDLRIIFELISNTVHLIDIGTHDEVY